MGNSASGGKATNGSSAEASRPVDATTVRLEQEFAKYANANGAELSRPNFHRTLDVIESLGYKRLRDTPLADMLFDFHAVNDVISAQNFRLAMETTLLGAPSARLLATFRAIAGRGEENAIPFARLVDLFERSWQVAAQTLSGKLMLGKQTDTAQLVQQFASANIQSLRDTLSAEFNAGAFISRADFTRFMAQDRNVIVVTKDGSCEVPTSFLFLQKTTSAYPSIARQPY